jgi:hypothetical protein
MLEVLFGLLDMIKNESCFWPLNAEFRDLNEGVQSEMATILKIEQDVRGSTCTGWGFRRD